MIRDNAIRASLLTFFVSTCLSCATYVQPIPNRAPQPYAHDATLALPRSYNGQLQDARTGPADCQAIVRAPGDLPGRWREESEFVAEIGGDINPLRLMTTTVLPGERLPLTIHARHRRASFVADASGGYLYKLGLARWHWEAPAVPGHHMIRVYDRAAGETMCINAFVMEPYDGRAWLNGYRIGSYPKRPLGDNPNYARPTGFIPVDDDVRDIWVAPRFRLNQFLCKQRTADQEYVALRTRLLLKLEYLLTRANADGIDASTFQILSAFRTPWYNRDIGNRTRYSRHSYGDAADIYIDEDGDGFMDDLDGDGRITARDGDVLYELVEDSTHDHEYGPFYGGLGFYPPNSHRGPFVHVDTRGEPVRWGPRIASRSTPDRLARRR